MKLKTTLSLIVIAAIVAAGAYLYYTGFQLYTSILQDENIILKLSALVALVCFLVIVLLQVNATTNKTEKRIRSGLLIIILLIAVFLSSSQASLGELFLKINSISPLGENCYTDSPSWYCEYDLTLWNKLLPLGLGIIFALVLNWLIHLIRVNLFSSQVIRYRFTVATQGFILFSIIEYFLKSYNSFSDLIFTNAFCYSSALLVIFCSDVDEPKKETASAENKKEDEKEKKKKKKKSDDNPEDHYPWSVG